MKKQYILVDVTQDVSRLNGSIYWRLTFVDVDDLTVWETTVDGSYRNFSNCGWDVIVSDPNPYGLYEGLIRSNRTSRRGHGVITADSIPKKVVQARDWETVFDVVEGLRQDAERKRQAPDQFRELFA